MVPSFFFAVKAMNNWKRSAIKQILLLLLAISWSGSSHLHLWRQKSKCSSHVVTQFMYVISGVMHTRTLLENLSVICDTFNRLINVPRYTSSSLAFAMNSTDHIKVVFRKFAYSLMSRVTTSPNGTITAIVNSDVYQRSPLMDKWESMYMYRNNHG